MSTSYPRQPITPSRTTDPTAGAFRWVHFGQLDSTMDEARRQRASGVESGCVSCDHQTAGRGRLPGRQWQDSEGSALLCTFWSPLPAYQAQVPSLVAGAALFAAVRSLLDAPTARKLRIKWPNDLLVDGKKLAGILCENAGGTVYTGIGLNLHQADFSAGFRREPVSLRQLGVVVPELGRLVEIIRSQLDFFCCTPNAWLPVVDAALFYKDQKVGFLSGTGNGAGIPDIQGILRGVGADGGIRIETTEGLMVLYSGELQTDN